uniref:C-type lectin domain-containing protein n=1 Tax=Acrobeloides nanus TaxID=290746 RepID=A0A914DKT2_9BILA
MAAQGNWIWAQLNGNGLSLSNTGYINWGSGMPINDTIKRCVSDQKTNKWQVEDCNTTQHFYACVKHVYDYTNVFEGENA